MSEKIVDPTLPGLTVALDSDQMQKVIEGQLQKENPHLFVETCRVTDVKYKPQMHCIIRYELKIYDQLFGNHWQQWISAQLFREDDEMLSPQSLHFVLPNLKAILSPFPHDPTLTWLPKIFDSKHMVRQLRMHFDTSPRKSKAEVMEYVPQMRATFKMEVQFENSTRPEHWIAKTHAFKNPSHQYANSLAVWKASQGKIGLAKPIGFLIDPHLHFQQVIPGVPLGSMIESPDIGDILMRTAEGIAHFHRLSIPMNSSRKIDQEIRSLMRWSDLLMQVQPEQEERIRTLRDAIASELEENFQASAPIHADFHQSNVLVHEGRAYIIDLDEMAYGDPCLDVGRFLSSLRVPSLRRLGDLSALQQERDLFLERYLQISDQRENHIRLFESASLFTSAASAFRVQKEGWEEDVDCMLNEVERIFKEAKKTSSKPILKEEIPSHIDWTKENKYLTARLAPSFEKLDCGHLVSCEWNEETTIYDTISWKEKQKIQGRIKLIQCKGEKTSNVYYRLKKMPNFLPRIIENLPEFDQLAFEWPKGERLIDCLNHETVKQLAKQLKEFHLTTMRENPRISSLCLCDCSLDHFIVTENGIVTTMLEEVNRKHPFYDVADLVLQLGEWRDDFLNVYGKNHPISMDKLDKFIDRKISSIASV